MKFLFVGGCARSGTTLVQKILLSHENISGGPEFGYTRPIFELYWKMKYVLNEGRLISFCNPESLKDIFSEFYSAFFTEYSSDEPQYISEKTPSNIYVVNELLEVFPEAKFIWIYRDGRAVLASHLKVKARAKKNKAFYKELRFGSICKLWNQSVTMQLEIEDSLKNDRILSIRYEDFISNPELQLERLFSFIGLKTNPDMLNPKLIQFEDPKYSAYINNIWYTEEMYHQNFDTNNIDKWRQELSAFQVIRANFKMSVNLDRLGYSTNRFCVKFNKFLNFLSKDSIKSLFRNTVFHKLYSYLRLKMS